MLWLAHWRRGILRNIALHGLLGVVLVFAANAYANGLAPVTLNELVTNADVVASLKILSAEQHQVEGKKCGVVYEASADNIYKSSPENASPNKIKFGRDEGLEVGKTYLIFLKKYNDPDEIYRAYATDPISEQALARASKPELLNLIGCNGIVPGFLYYTTLAWPIDGLDVIVPPEVLLKVPPEVHMDDHSGSMYFLRYDSLSHYLSNITK